MMWALEYDPDLFLLYEDPKAASEKSDTKGRAKSIRQYGKYEREHMKNGAKNSEAPLPISVFLVASVLKDRSSKLMTEAHGLDDVVKVSLALQTNFISFNALKYPTLDLTIFRNGSGDMSYRFRVKSCFNSYKELLRTMSLLILCLKPVSLVYIGVPA